MRFFKNPVGLVPTQVRTAEKHESPVSRIIFILLRYSSSSMAELFPFGKYAGKPVEYVAMKDYPYLAWINPKIGKPSLRKRVEDVRHSLNSFQPAKDCEHCQASPASNLSILSAESNFTHEGMSVRWDLGGAYLICSSGTCQTYAGNRLRLLEPIRLDALLRFTGDSAECIQPRKDVRALQDTLLECAGFTGRKTEARCIDFIRDLEGRIKIPQYQTPAGIQRPEQASLFS